MVVVQNLVLVLKNFNNGKSKKKKKKKKKKNKKFVTGFLKGPK